MTGTDLALELFHLIGENEFAPRSQHNFSFRGFFPNFRRSPSSRQFYMGVSPLSRRCPISAVHSVPGSTQLGSVPRLGSTGLGCCIAVGSLKGVNIFFYRKAYWSSESHGTIMRTKLRYLPEKEEIQAPRLMLPSSWWEKTDPAVYFH